MTPQDFLAESFQGSKPTTHSLWLNDDINATAKTILKHAYPTMRIRYWREGQRTAWIMNEIGKTKPITIGVSIAEQGIERMRILAFRESRGGEVRMPFFTRQFKGQSLLPDGHALSEHVDGISGATLSVRAVKNTARFALYLHNLVVENRAEPKVGSKVESKKQSMTVNDQSDD